MWRYASVWLRQKVARTWSIVMNAILRAFVETVVLTVVGLLRLVGTTIMTSRCVLLSHLMGSVRGDVEETHDVAGM